MVICFGYETSPNMMGIQDGYNKNFHKKCIEYYEKFDAWWLFWDIIQTASKIKQNKMTLQAKHISCGE